MNPLSPLCCLLLIIVKMDDTFQELIPTSRQCFSDDWEAKILITNSAIQNVLFNIPRKVIFLEMLRVHQH